MNAGYGQGRSGSGNTIYFTLKIKRGQVIDPHIEVRKLNPDTGKIELDNDKCTNIAGRFAGIDHGTYIPAQGKPPKNKIMLYLVNDTTKEIYLVQSTINGHARNLMNTMLNLLYNHADNLEMLEISVWSKEKNGNTNANLTVRHENPAIGHTTDDMVGWQFDWEKQKAMITFVENGYNDYSKLENFLLEKWIAAKVYLQKEFPKYGERLSILSGATAKPSGYDPNKKEDGENIFDKKNRESEAPDTGAPIPDEPQANIGEEFEEDDLPF